MFQPSDAQNFFFCLMKTGSKYIPKQLKASQDQISHLTELADLNREVLFCIITTLPFFHSGGGKGWGGRGVMYLCQSAEMAPEHSSLTYTKPVHVRGRDNNNAPHLSSPSNIALKDRLYNCSDVRYKTHTHTHAQKTGVCLGKLGSSSTRD